MNIQIKIKLLHIQATFVILIQLIMSLLHIIYLLY